MKITSNAAGTEDVGLRNRRRLSRGALTLVTAATAAFAVTACGGSSDKSYDISPIFPLSSNKCAKYNGDSKGQNGSGGCWVTKADCERASADWRNAMKNVPDAILFRC